MGSTGSVTGGDSPQGEPGQDKANGRAASTQTVVPGAGLWGSGQFLGGRDLHGAGGWVTELAILQWLGQGGGGWSRLQGVGLAHLASDSTPSSTRGVQLAPPCHRHLIGGQEVSGE